MVDKTVINSVPGREFPLGISLIGRKINVAVSLPDATVCRLIISTEGQLSKVKLYESNVYRGIFTCSFDYSGKKGFDYVFETDAERVIDPYAHSISGREMYGPGSTAESTRGESSACGAATEEAEVKKTETLAAGIEVKAEKTETSAAGSKAEVKTANFGADGIAAHFEVKPFDWKQDVRPDIPYCDMIIYKLHVRGFTAGASSGVKCPGTFEGVSQKIKYIKSLGFNTVLLMPCYEFDENIGTSSYRLNFWGYGTQASYFAPKASYASKPGDAVNEFKNMVRLLHKEKIAVMMEMDLSRAAGGCMVTDILRFWAGEYHIDGFRIIGQNTFAQTLAGDPYLRGIKLIAGDWDGAATVKNSEEAAGALALCNDGFMINCRRFLKGDEGQVKEFGENFSTGCVPDARINYIADHDGFTLNDLFSYDERHNMDNGEKNCDGREINYSWNCGVEGTTSKKSVNRLRLRMLKNALTVLLLSQGTPMLLAGDEFGNTHFGNNNPYCQDNRLSYVNWVNSRQSRELRDFVTGLTALRKAHRVLSNTAQLKGRDYIFCGNPDISFHGLKAWYPDYGYYSRTLGILLNGQYALKDRVNADSSFFIAFNMHWEEHEFDLPTVKGTRYILSFATDECQPATDGRTCIVPPRSIAVFETVNEPDGTQKRKKGRGEG